MTEVTESQTEGDASAPRSERTYKRTIQSVVAALRLNIGFIHICISLILAVLLEALTSVCLGSLVLFCPNLQVSLPMLISKHLFSLKAFDASVHPESAERTAVSTNC